jgi:hypothetical protein
LFVLNENVLFFLDTQKNLDHYRDSVGKFSSEVTDEKKKLVDKAKFKRHKKNVLDSGVFESKTDSFSRESKSFWIIFN